MFEIKDVTPFDPIVLKVHYDGFDWKKLKPICDNLIKTTNSQIYLENGNAGSTVNNKLRPDAMPEFADFYKWLDPIAQYIITDVWGFNRDFEYAVRNSWINYHGYGGETLEHHHGHSVLSLAAYLQFPDNSGFIEYRDPNEYQKTFFPKDTDDLLSNWKEVKATTGDVVMFPGWLRHRTQKNKSTEKRWVLSTNYICTNDFKAK
jgi:uncharacterized protein (TIGR02466 family)